MQTVKEMEHPFKDSKKESKDIKKEKTILERVAKVIHDLETVRVLRKEDNISFSGDIGYVVEITLTEISGRVVYNDLRTIKKCFKDEFGTKIQEMNVFRNTNTYKGVISADDERVVFL